MSDDMNMSGEDQFAPMGEVTPAPPAPMIKPESISRNALLIVAGVILLAVAVALVMYAMSLANTTTTPVAVFTPGGTPGTTSGTTPGTTTSATAPPTSIATVDDRDVFTPRNPFTVIAPVAIAIPATSSVNTTETPSGSSEISLSDIVTSGGVLKAVVKFNGHTYTLGEGSLVPGSTITVIAIRATEVDFSDSSVADGDGLFTLTPGSK